MVEVMRRWWIVLTLAACTKRQDPPTAQQGSGSAALAAPADAQVADMAAPDAMVAVVPVGPVVPVVDAAPTGPAPVDTDTLLDVETVGPLKVGMTEADAVKSMGGPPKKKSLPVEEAATSEFASTWTWPDATLEMVSETRSGKAKVRLITVRAALTFATRRGIAIGSTRAQVAAAYPKSDEGSDDPMQFLVGSPYGGLLFVFKGDVVAEILLGPLAF
jgi:hypothetical protein